MDDYIDKLVSELEDYKEQQGFYRCALDGSINEAVLLVHPNHKDIEKTLESLGFTNVMVLYSRACDEDKLLAVSDREVIQNVILEKMSERRRKKE